MNLELALKIQAFLDGELPAAESASVRALIEKDAAAQALLTELKWSRQALANHEPRAPLPEPSDFYWSKILREIRAGERQPVRLSREFGGSWLAYKWLLPAAGLALVLLLFALPKDRQSAANRAAESSEVAIADTTGLAFHSETDGMTVVWVQSDAN